MTENQIVSLDIETSSPDIRGSILSIGLVQYPRGDQFYQLVDHEDGLFVKPEAMRVNRLTMDDLSGNRCCLETLDRRLNQWLKPHSIAMGRGINHFDMKFIQKDLPMTWARFNQSLFDLNGFMRGMALRLVIDFEEIRKNALSYAAQKCDEKFLSKLWLHHALYDAWENCFVLDFLKTL